MFGTTGSVSLIIRTQYELGKYVAVIVKLQEITEYRTYFAYLPKNFNRNIQGNSIDQTEQSNLGLHFLSKFPLNHP